MDAYKHQFGVEPICAVLTEHHMPIAPSSYYAHRRRPVSAALLAQAHLVNLVIDLHRRNRSVYRIRKMWHLLMQKGQQVGRDQVARLMRIAGLEGVRRGRHHTVTTTRRREGEVRAPDLIGRRTARPGRISNGSRTSPTAGPRVLLRLVRRRRVLPPDPGLAGVDVQDHRPSPVRRRTSPAYSPGAYRYSFHHNRFSPSLRRRVAERIQLIVATPDSEVGMGRPAGWMASLTGRSAMKLPGAPSHRREVLREFWIEIAKGLWAEDAAEAVGVSPAVGTRWFRHAGGMSPTAERLLQTVGGPQRPLLPSGNPCTRTRRWYT